MEVLDSSESFLHWDRTLSELSESGDQDNVLYSTHFSGLLDDLSQDALLLGQLLSDPFLSGGGGGGGGRGRASPMEQEGEEEEGAESPPPPHIAAEHSYSLCGDSRPQSPLSHLNGEAGGSDAGESELSDWTMEEQGEESMDTLLCESPSLLPALPGLALTLDGPPVTPTSPDAPGVPQGPPAGPDAPPRAPHSPRGRDPPAKTSHSQAKSVKIKQEVIPQIKLEPHEVDQFLNLSPKAGLELLRMPPTPPSSHGSDSEGSQSPTSLHGGHAPLGGGGASPPRSPPAAAAAPLQSPGHKGAPATTPRASSSSSSSSLSNSPLLTAPHKLQGSGPLLLTEEERRTLVAEGYPVPTKLPLSKAEEKALKKIRRKIKNKISAQESRRKKKEYMDALEKKVENCSNENSELRRKVENLECTNKSLLQQLQSLQAVVSGKVPKTTQTSSCLMVAVLCFAVFLGHFYPSSLTSCSTVTESGVASKPLPESYSTSVKSRNLLSAFEDSGEPHLLGLGGDYPDQWVDTPAVVMAAWRRSETQKLTEEEEAGPSGGASTTEKKPLLPGGPFRLSGEVETPRPPLRSNETQQQQQHKQQSNNIVLELHRVDQRWNDSSSKVLHLDRTVNETS